MQLSLKDSWVFNSKIKWKHCFPLEIRIPHHYLCRMLSWLRSVWNSLIYFSSWKVNLLKAKHIKFISPWWIWLTWIDNVVFTEIDQIVNKIVASQTFYFKCFGLCCTMYTRTAWLKVWKWKTGQLEINLFLGKIFLELFKAIFCYYIVYYFHNSTSNCFHSVYHVWPAQCYQN